MRKFSLLLCWGGHGGQSLPVVFGLLGTVVVPKNRTLVITARVLLKARITKGVHGCLSKRCAWSSRSWSTAVSAEKSGLWPCGLIFGSIAEGKEWMHPILACNTKGWLLEMGFHCPTATRGQGAVPALRQHCHCMLQSHPCTATPVPSSPTCISGTVMLWGRTMPQGHRRGAQPGGC